MESQMVKENDMGVYIEGLDKQVQKGAESITVTFWDKDELIINEYDIGDMSKVTDLNLVRCGECKWYDKDFKDCNIRDSYGWDYKPTDFCSYGKRRTDETIESITFKKMVKAVKEEMRDVQNFAERRNDGTVCSYGVPANADQHTQRVESVGERRADE